MRMHVSGLSHGSHINPPFVLIQLPLGQFD